MAILLADLFLSEKRKGTRLLGYRMQSAFLLSSHTQSFGGKHDHSDYAQTAGIHADRQ